MIHAEDGMRQLRDFLSSHNLSHDVMSLSENKVDIVVKENNIEIPVWFDVTNQAFGFDMITGGSKSYNDFSQFSELLVTYVELNTKFIPSAKIIADAFCMTQSCQSVYENFSGNRKSGYTAKFRCLNDNIKGILVQHNPGMYIAKLVEYTEDRTKYRVLVEYQYEFSETGDLVLVPNSYSYWDRLCSDYETDEALDISRTDYTRYIFTIDKTVIDAEVMFNYLNISYQVYTIDGDLCAKPVILDNPYDLRELRDKCLAIKQGIDPISVPNVDGEEVAESADVAESLEGGGVTEVSESSEVTDITESDDVAEVAEVAESSESMEIAEGAEGMESDESTESAEVAQPAQVAEVAESAESTEVAEVAELTSESGQEEVIESEPVQDEIHQEDSETEKKVNPSPDESSSMMENIQASYGTDEEPVERIESAIQTPQRDEEVAQEDKTVSEDSGVDDMFDSEEEETELDSANNNDVVTEEKVEEQVPEEETVQTEVKAEEVPAEDPVEEVKAGEQPTEEPSQEEQTEDVAVEEQVVEEPTDVSNEASDFSVKIVTKGEDNVYLQFISEQEICNMAFDKAESLGIPTGMIRQTVELINNHGIEISMDEKSLRRFAKDVTADDAKCAELVGRLFD